MRILLVGPSAARARLRLEIAQTSWTVAGEFASLRAARASGLDADGILLSSAGDRLLDGREADDIGRPFPIHPLDDDPEFDEPLTPRETEVVELLAEGLSNKAIAARLGISDQTVKFHVAAVSGKLGAVNRTDAVRRAARRGLISL